MGIVVGFAVGYLLGTRAGRERFDELIDAARTIAGSKELQSLMMVGTTVLTRAIVDGAFTPRGSNGDGLGLAGLLGDQVRRALVQALKPTEAV
ncbi:MAG TPA: hypothetical protein VN646_26155 [Candidatus Acidoferrum sp.]|jgi:hypothetical protein|nr:hypothetical protein [Candidatus Acidoferrum sp.]